MSSLQIRWIREPKPNHLCIRLPKVAQHTCGKTPVTVLVGGPVQRMLPTILVLPSNGSKHPPGYWICSQVRRLCSLWSTSALCSPVFCRLTIFVARAWPASLAWRAAGASESQSHWPPARGGPLTRRWHCWFQGGESTLKMSTATNYSTAVWISVHHPSQPQRGTTFCCFSIIVYHLK